MEKSTFMPNINYVWKCPDCGKEISASKNDPQEITSDPQCPECGKKMEGDYLKKY